jgi:hypothetical protein
MAGLVAADTLLRAGHDPLILEAQARVGGRIQTIRDPFAPRLYAEAGAMRIPRTHTLTLEPWPNGSYRVELYLADKLAHTARFRVEGVSAKPAALIPQVGPPPASGPPGRLGAILFAKGQSDNDPVEPATQFDEGVRAVYAFTLPILRRPTR